MAPSLHETQRWLAGVLLDRAALDAGQLDASGALAHDAATARVRLAAYAGGYPARLEEALADAFPALCHVLGGAAFHGLVQRYLPAVPAGIYNLNDVGAPLPAWLAGDQIARALPLAPDLARLELAVQQAFHAALLPPFDPAPLSAWGPGEFERAIVRFQPGVSLVRSPWPVHDVWQARTQARDALDVLLAEPRAQDVLVSRTGYQVTPAVVAPEQAALLERLLAGERLGTALNALEATPVPGEAVTAWFAGWVQRGLVAECGL